MGIKLETINEYVFSMGRLLGLYTVRHPVLLPPPLPLPLMLVLCNRRRYSYTRRTVSKNKQI
jgi:hypothetical protein